MITRSSRGFSLVELVITIVIIGLLLALAVPAARTSTLNSSLRATAQTFQSGLQLARSEALSRNARVQFMLTSATPVLVNSVANSMGGSWVVRTTGAIPALIETKVAAEAGTNSVTVNDTDNNGIPNAGAVDTITFTGLGTTTLAATTTFTFTSPTGGACAPIGPIRCLNVQVMVGGQIRICDPAATDANDTRICL